MRIQRVYSIVRKVKLQKIDNSLRVTIPKEVADDLYLKQGQNRLIDVKDGDIVMRKEGPQDMSRFYGALHLLRHKERGYLSYQTLD